nr:MAG TPA: hypothetical protein [Caudoviricetes sp.]
MAPKTPRLLVVQSSQIIQKRINKFLGAAIKFVSFQIFTIRYDTNYLFSLIFYELNATIV